MQSIGSLQKKYSIGSFELLSKTTPIQAGSLLVLGPVVDFYLSGNLIFDYNFGGGVIVSTLLLTPITIYIVALVFILHGQSSFLTNTGWCIPADVHTSVVFSGRVLQREPVLVHRTFFSCFLSSVGSHENSVRPYFGMGVVRLPTDFQEHHGDARSRGWHDSL